MINILNNDVKCFIWCILAAIYADSVSHTRDRVSHYRHYESELDMTGLKIACNAPSNTWPSLIISISVYGWEEAKVDYNKK